MKVLVVDDQEAVPNSLAIVQRLGHELVRADVLSCRWSEIVSQARSCDIVLLDLGMNAGVLFDGEAFEHQVGEELLRRMRDAKCEVPVVVLTHLTVDGPTDQRLRRLGVRHVTYKHKYDDMKRLMDTIVDATRERG